MHVDRCAPKTKSQLVLIPPEPNFQEWLKGMFEAHIGYHGPQVWFSWPPRATSAVTHATWANLQDGSRGILETHIRLHGHL